MNIANALGGGTPPKSDPSYWTDGSIPWVSPKDMKVFLVDATEDAVTTKALDRLTLIPKNSVLVVVRSGILARTLPVAINKAPVTTNQDMRAFVPANGVNSRFLAWQLIANEREILDRCSKDGTTVASIEGPALAAYPLLVAPSKEQARIVEKLEELLSDLDAGVAELNAAQRKLAQYRQSLLKAAVEGALTADWRAARARSGESRETGANLRQRILTERRTRWEAKKLAKYAEQGKTPPKGWQAKYPEPVAPNTDGLPLLPTGWTWASVEQIASDDAYSLAIGPFGSNLVVSDYRSSGVPLIFVRNIRSKVFHETKYVTKEKAAELRAHRVDSGDVLVTKMGEPPGDAAVYPAGRPPAIITADCIKIRPLQGWIAAEYLCAAINSPIGVYQIKPMTQGVAQKKVSLGRFSTFAVPLPSIEEQSQIVASLDVALASIEQQERAIHHGIALAEAQRKNILKAAFAGQLVPQNPNDEPAGALLERIRAERASQAGTATPRGRKTRTTV
jgi:type I restriction enzyme S subunit